MSAGRMDREHPKALDLAARLLVALGDHLRGVAGMLRGTHSEDHWREMLRGERTLPLYDVCRLATDPTREAPASIVAALHVLAEAVGYQLQPVVQDPAANLHRDLATFSRSAGAAGGGIAEALEDQDVTPAEARRELDRLRNHEEVVARMKSNLEAIARRR